MTNNSNEAFIIIDVQNCFMPDGSLPVPKGDEVVSEINKLIPQYQNVILTQDWHPPSHISFASSHPGKNAFETIQLDYGEQVLWSDHAIIGTKDANFHKDLDISQAQLIIRKGFHHHTDSYSAFIEADKKTPTGLTGYLRERKINKLYFVGLATDFCVAWSAIDACTNGFTTYVIDNACRAINLNNSLAIAWQQMQSVGVIKI